MGVYYYIYNKTKNYNQNMYIINGRFCDFVTNFDKYEEEFKKEIFKKCIILNNWDITDIILAVPDYYNHDIYRYENDKISIDNCDKDKFFITQ